MNWKPDRYGGLRALLRGPRVAQEVEEEFEHHLALRVAAGVARGLSEQAAREDALRRFGSLEAFARQTIEIDESVLKEERRMEVFDSIRRETKQSLRGLLRAPGFTFIALITLALGIGATTAVYTLLKAVVLDPMPYPQPERLVVIKHAVPGIGEGVEWDMSSGSYFHFKGRARGLEALSVYTGYNTNLRARGDAIQGEALYATPNLYGMLGARPAAGRLFRVDEGEPGASEVVVVSYGYWQREYGGDPSAIGSTVLIDGNPTEVIGVMAEGFELPRHSPDVFGVLRLNPAGPHWNSHYLNSIAKLAPGVGIDALVDELRALTAELPEAYPKAYYPGFIEKTQFAPAVVDLRQSVVNLDVARILWVILGSVAVVLLIACVNVANLFLVRSEARRNELAVRSALGAERAHLFVQSLTEALLLSLTAGWLGIWIAYGGLRILIALAPTSLPRLSEVQLGAPTILFAMGVALAAGVVFALFPVIRRAVDYGPLREGGRGMTASRGQLRARSTLVTAQIALALVLLAAAGLMLRSFQRMRSVDLGFNPEGVLTLQVALPSSNYKQHDQVARFWQQFNSRVGALPDVTRVAGTISLPMGGGTPCAVMKVTPAPANPKDLGCPAYNIVTPDYFQAAGINVRGRTPTWSDVESGTGAVVISAALAEQLWPGEDPIGKGVRVPNSEDEVYYRIVGIADDVLSRSVREAPPTFVYYPIKPIQGAPLWQAQNALVVLVRSTSTNPESLTGSVRSILRELEPAAALGTVQTWQKLVNESMIQTSFTMVLLGVAGGMALLLAVVGLYGVVAYTVSRRRAEIGIRMALGANVGEVGGMVLMQSVRLCAIGVGIGLLAAGLTMQTLRSLLFEVTPTDPVTLTVVSFMLLGVAALASIIPARRAARVDPVEALRS